MRLLDRALFVVYFAFVVIALVGIVGEFVTCVRVSF